MTDQTPNLLALLYRHDVPSPEALLQHALIDLGAWLPDATSAVVYRVAHGGLALWHSTVETDVPGTYVTLTADSPHQQAIVTGLATTDAEDHTVSVPLRAQSGEIFALLVVTHSEVPQLNGIETFAEQLSYVLYSKHLENLLKRQNEATQQLNQAESIGDVVQMLAQNLLEPEQHVALNLFVYDNGEVVGARTAYTASHKKLYTPDEPLGVQKSYVQSIHDDLQNSGEILISDLETDTRLNPDDREWLISRGARSSYLIPLYLQDKLYAFIAFSDSKRAQAFTTEEKQLYLNLAQQARAIIEKNQLLERTQAGLQQSQLLYDLVGNLMQAEDIPQILEILYKYVGEGTRNVTFNEFTYDENGIVTDIRIRYVISGDEAREVDVSWFDDEPDDQEMQNMLEHAQKLGDELEILEDYDQYKEDLLILKRLQRQGINSSLAIPIFEEGRRTHQITLAWGESQTFDERLVQLMRTAKSQIGLVLKNRDLLASVQAAAHASQQQAERLQLIANFGQTMQSSLVIPEILTAILDYGRRIIEVDYVAVMTYDRGLDALRLVARQWKAASDLYTPGQVLEAGQDTIAERAWKQQELIQVEKLGGDWEHQHPLMDDLTAVLAIPLISGGVLLGVVEVGREAGGAYKETDKIAFQQMSNQLAVALGNAETYAQSQKIAQNKGTANEIIAQLQQQADVSSILRVTATELGQALGAKRARIRLGMGDNKRSSGD